MFKRIIALAAVAILAACGGTAHAAPYQANNGTVFSIEKVRKAESTIIGGQQVVVLTYETGEVNSTPLTDNGGAIFGKIKANNPYWLITANQLTVYNPGKAKTVTCGGGGTVFTWYGSSPELVSDGCVLYSQSTGKTN